MSLGRTINTGVQYLYQLWDENAAAAGAIVFIPSLLVGAAHFSSQVVYFGTSPCYWLFVDVLILCYTVAVVTSCIDIATDLYCFLARVSGDSVPLIVGKDNAAPYPKSFNQRIFWAMVFRVIGSTFALLLLTSATAMTLVPIPGLPGPEVSNNSTSMSLPIQCTTLSDPTYHFKLFFGFAVVAVVFAGLRFAFVHQSKKNSPDHGHSHGDHHGHGHGHGHHHDHKPNDDYHHELTVVSTPRPGEEKKVGEAKNPVIDAPAQADDKPSEEKEAEKETEEKDEDSEDSEDSEEKRRRRKDRRRRRRERRERKKRDDGSDEDDDDD